MKKILYLICGILFLTSVTAIIIPKDNSDYQNFYNLTNVNNLTSSYFTIKNPAVSCESVGTNCFTVQVNGSTQICSCFNNSGEIDPLWNSNFTLYNGSWSSTYNSTYNDYINTNYSNNSQYLQGYTPTTLKNWIQGLFDSIYCKLTGCTMNGEIDMNFNNIINVNNLNVSGNISTLSYFDGQPITGSIGSGIIWANGTNNYAEINISCSGLVCSYTAFKVRLVKTDNSINYCDIPAGSYELTDNQHNVVYVDFDCNINSISVQDYIQTPTSPGGQADFMNIIAYDGSTENINGIGLENKRQIKLRKLLLRSSGKHLSVVSGMDYQTNGFTQFNITSGEYVYLYDIVPSTLQQTSINAIEVVYHSGIGTWTQDEQNGLNLTSCDTGTGIITCTNTNRYRRHFIFIVGNNDSGTDETKLHQLLPLESTNYVTLEQCLNTERYPLTYIIPEYYEYGAVMLYSYCGRASDSAWIDTNFIDLRTVKTGSATSITDGVYVKVDGTEPLTNNWNVGLFNITTDWFKGNIDWTNLTNFPVACPSGTYVTQIGDSITCESANLFYLLKTGDNATGDYNFDNGTLRINSSTNKVRINTYLDEGAYLHVVAPDNVPAYFDRTSNDTSAAGVTYRKSRGTNIVQTNDIIGNILSQAWNGASYQNLANLRFAAENVSAGKISGSAQFVLANSAGTMVERMRLTSNGYLGILTTTPQNQLNVIGSTNSTTGFIVGANIGITGNYTNGFCWTTYSGGIVIGTNCTAI